jgi:hypothetical protein
MERLSPAALTVVAAPGQVEPDAPAPAGVELRP